ncbi:MAG: hypothetical protein EOM02_00390 [Synergistales bacterium]|nr:hypothetical protein [Synergistales bacterium]
MDGFNDERLEQLVDEDLGVEEAEPVVGAEPNPDDENVSPDSESESNQDVDEIPYTPEEIKRLGIDKLDPNKLPPELVPFYRSMQSDYTRKTQRVAELESKLRASAEPHGNNAPAPDPKQFVQSLTEAAKARACALLGVTVDRFDEFDPQHQTAFSVANNEIQQQLMSARNAQLGQERAKQTFESVIGSYAQSEPNFDRITTWVDDWADSLPISKYNQVISDVQSGDPNRVKAVVEEVRRAWYDVHRPKKSAPPKVVSPGAGSPSPTKRTLTGKEFAGMPEEEQLNLLTNLLEE